jgi:hypothetical protein
MIKYALLLGYGIFGHAKVSQAKYADYVKSFASYVNQNKIDIIIISGGHTSPKRPLESEAESIEKYLKPLLKRNTTIILENWSLTTLENIEFSKKFINLDSSNITIFCDNIRPQKVIWLILHFWFGLDKKKIEKYFIDYSVKYYVTHFTDEGLGKEMSKGFTYKNVTVKPYPMRVDIDDAISAITGDILEINSLYEKSIRTRLIKYVKVKLQLIE